MAGTALMKSVYMAELRDVFNTNEPSRYHMKNQFYQT